MLLTSRCSNMVVMRTGPFERALRRARAAVEKEKGMEIDEQQFPSCILYSSPPEASSLGDWLREVRRMRERESNALQTPYPPPERTQGPAPAG